MKMKNLFCSFFFAFLFIDCSIQVTKTFFAFLYCIYLFSVVACTNRYNFPFTARFLLNI